MTIELTPLPYLSSSLQPQLSARTVELLHAQHQRNWLDRVNARVTGTELADAPLDKIVRETQGTLHEAAAQAWNLDFQWQCLRPRGGGEPDGALGERVRRQFGDVARLRAAFTEAALGLFGSGWAWLVQQPDGHLAIQVTRNAGTPLTGLATPLLACCLWEQAYYLDYQNDRSRWLEAWWSMVNWEFAASQMR